MGKMSSNLRMLTNISVQMARRPSCPQFLGCLSQPILGVCGQPHSTGCPDRTRLVEAVGVRLFSRLLHSLVTIGSSALGCGLAW